MEARKRKKSRKWIKISSILLFPILGLLYLSYLFSIALENHYDVQRGSFLWYATMDNQTITEFPIIKSIDGYTTYNSIGGDSPNIGTGWEIAYTSKEEREILTAKILQYLNEEGYQLKEVNETQFYWKGKHKKSDSNQLYSGANKKGESLDLLFVNYGQSTKIECSIVY